MGWLLGPGGIELLSLSIDSDGIAVGGADPGHRAVQRRGQHQLAGAAGQPRPTHPAAADRSAAHPGGRRPVRPLALPRLAAAGDGDPLHHTRPHRCGARQGGGEQPGGARPIREGLNQESGLNDGICVPVLLLLLALIAPTEEHSGTGLLALTLMLEEIGIGLLVAWG